MSGCKECGKPLGRGNKSGYCVAHVSAALAQRPDWVAKQKAGIKRKLASDPIYLERKRADMRKAQAFRDVDALRQRMRDNRLWEKSNATRPPGHPSRLQAARSITETRLAGIPPHLRKEYLHLVRYKHIKAVEARQIILAQHDADMARFRKKFAPPEPAPPQPVATVIPAVNIKPVKADLPPPPNLLESIARDFGFTLTDLLSRSRTTDLARCRQTAYAVLRARGHSYNQIARWMQRKDHSTVVHGCAHFSTGARHAPKMARVFRAYTTENDNAAESEAA